MTEPPLKIGDVARRVGTTPRTIRYYEEIGLLPPAADRPAGGHRAYGEADVERLGEILRLKDLLGVSLDQLRELVAAEDARAAIRAEYRRTEDPRRRRELLDAALENVERQLALVSARRAEVDTLERELVRRRDRVHLLLEEVQP
ncbi:MAG TPA: MerR family transcriptional regulator [Solirubrobacteraceae bacterium]|nr:MerR family transcriptional regulator [Solirubrobacteraceae bacterium]